MMPVSVANGDRQKELLVDVRECVSSPSRDKVKEEN